MFLRNLKIFLLSVAIISASSCKFQKIVKSTDLDRKYEAAVNYYNKKDYYRALQLLEELIAIFRGSSRAELSYYYYCKCHFETQQYTLAAYHFKNFVQTFPNSRYAEECLFLNAYCYYLDSSVYSLDQASTREAISQFQLFIDKHPKSDRITECNNLIDLLRLKLETKAFENAKLFYRMEDYRASIVSFENVLRDFPSTAYKEESMWLMVKAAYHYASASVESKQAERYRNTLEYYRRFKENFPQSGYMKEADRIKTDCELRLKKNSMMKEVSQAEK